jgi:hypothetical protein
MKKALSTIANKVRRNKVVAPLVVLLVVVVSLTTSAYSQLGLDPCCAIISAGLNTISGLLKSAVSTPLAAMQQIQLQTADFEQKIIYPLASLNEAKSVAVQFQTQFAAMRQIAQLPIHSATLAVPQALEQQLLSRSPSAIPLVAANYSQLYGKVMPSTDAPPQVRDLVDAADAEAQAAMKKAIEIDALADMELQAAEQFNQQLGSASPGSAAILEAQTSAWLLRANAHAQSAMAELLRLRSIELANHSAQLKFSSAHAVNLHDKTNQLLQGPR